MQALKNLISISNDNHEKAQILKLEIQAIQTKLEDKKFINKSQTSPNSQKDFLKYLIGLYTIDYKAPLEINLDYISLLESVSIELIENFIPQIIGCYLIYTQICRDLAGLLFDIILQLSKQSLKMSHMIFFNLLSSKNSYKIFISPLEIKALMTKFMKNWQCHEDTAFNDYVTMFDKISSFDEFVDKNISLFNFQDMKSFIYDSEINWDKMMSNIKFNVNSESDVSNSLNTNMMDESVDSWNLENTLNGSPIEQFKWKRYISFLNLVNDLVTISEMLKFIPLEYRNKALLNFISFINTIQLPVSYISLDFTANYKNEKSNLNHKNILLRVCEQYAFCLSTKDKVPFHILLEIGNQPDEDVLNEELKIDNEDLNEIKTSALKKSQELFQNFKEELIKNTYNITNDKNKDRFDDISSYKEIFKPIPLKPAKESRSFFSFIFNCFGSQETDTENDEDIKSKENSKDSTSYLYGLFGDKTFSEVSSTLINNSNHQKIQNRKIISVIVKGNEDMRQDQFVYQIMEIFLTIFEKENLEIYLRPLKIISTGRGGLIETLTNTISLQKIKGINYEELLKSTTMKNMETASWSNDSNSGNNYYDNNGNLTTTYSQYFGSNKRNNNQTSFNGSLINYFKLKFGNCDSQIYKQAVNNFMTSLVGYSLLCYVLEIKDRNNGNILVDDEGHIIHIDFGFLLSNSPGNLNFEKAPFKFTSEFIEILNGFESELFKSFQDLFFKGFIALRNNLDYITSFIDIFILSNSDLPCFYRKERISDSIREKFMSDNTNGNFISSDNYSIKEFTDNLIYYSYENWRTKFYDRYQKYCVGIN